MNRCDDPHSERALILAPFGRDAGVAAKILTEAGIEATVCADLPCMMRKLAEGRALQLSSRRSCTSRTTETSPDG